MEIVRKSSMVEELNEEFAKMRDGCFKKPSGGCDCNIEREDGTTGVETFEVRARDIYLNDWTS